LNEILLVDDDATIRFGCAHVLEREGYRVTQAETGRVALQLLRRKKFDILITDVIMPEMDGLELIRSVRAVDPDIRIIAMSGGSFRLDLDFLSFASAFGANASLMKPFASHQLLDLLPVRAG